MPSSVSDLLAELEKLLNGIALLKAPSVPCGVVHLFWVAVLWWLCREAKGEPPFEVLKGSLKNDNPCCFPFWERSPVLGLNQVRLPEENTWPTCVVQFSLYAKLAPMTQ